MSKLRIGQMLEAEGLIGRAGLLSALQHQRSWGCRLGRALVALGLLREEALLAVLGRQIGVRVVRIGAIEIDRRVLARVPAKLIRDARALPVQVRRCAGHEQLVVAFATPDDLALVDRVSFAAGMHVLPVLAGEADLDQAIARHLDLPAERDDWLTRGDALPLPPPPIEPMTIVRGRRRSD